MIFPLSPKTKIIAILSAWGLAGIIAIIILPQEWKWLAAIPLSLMVLAPLIVGIIIFIRPYLPKPITSVTVRGKKVTCCQLCSQADTRRNPVNPNYPVVKCLEQGRTSYAPMKIPRWCPYAK